MKITSLILAAGISLALNGALHAVDYTWTAGSASIWSTPASWSPASPGTGPTSGDSIVGVTAGGALQLQGGSSYQVTDFTATTPSGASWAVQSGGSGATSLTVSGTFTMNSTKNTFIINNAFGGSTLDFNPANISVVNTTGNLLLGNLVNATALNGVSVSGTTTVNTGARILMNVTGSANLGALIADGTVSLANSNDNSISRSVTVSSLAGGGVVRGNGSGSGTGITAGLTISGSSNSTFSGTIVNGTGSVVSVTKSGSGTQTLSNANTYTGATTVTAGTLVLSSTGSIASSTIGFGVADSSNGLLTAENAAFSFGGALSLNLNTVTVTNASWTLFNGTTFGAGDLNLSGVTSNLAGLVFTNNSGIWSGTDLSFRTWTFSEDLGTLNVVPEPTTWGLLTIGLVIAVTFRSRRKSGLC